MTRVQCVNDIHPIAKIHLRGWIMITTRGVKGKSTSSYHVFFDHVLRFLSFNESTFHGKSYLKNATSSTISVGCMRSDRCLEEDI